MTYTLTFLGPKVHLRINGHWAAAYDSIDEAEAVINAHRGRRLL